MGIKRDSFGVLLTSCLMMGVEICIQIVLARSLGIEGRGSFAVCWTFFNILLMIGIFGVGEANIYHIASSRHTVSQVFGANVWIAVIGSLIICIGAYGIIHLPIDFFSKASKTAFLLTITGVGPFIFSVYMVSILRGMSCYKAMNAMNLLGPVLALVCMYLLCFHFEFGVKGAIIGRIVGQVFVVVFAVIQLWPKLVFKELLFGYRQVFGILPYAFRACFGFFAQRMSIQVNILVIAFMLTRAEVGFYAIAITMVMRILTVPNSLRRILLTKLAQHNATDGVLICQSLQIMLPVVVLVSIALGLVCNPLIKYGFGKEFLPALTAIYLLLISIVFRTATELVTTYLLAINRPGISSSIRLSGVFVNFVFLLILVPPYGLIGGCVATIISYMLESFVMVYVFMRISDTKSWRSLILQKSNVVYLWNSVYSLIPRFKQNN